MQIQWYLKSASEVIDALKSTEEGLSQQEVISRLKEYGQNKLPETKPDSIFNIFFRQFKSPLIYILFFAGIIILAMGHFTDAIIIFSVLIFNAFIGAIQEGKAQNTFLSLKKYSGSNVTVIREKEEEIVKDTEIVPGDVVFLQEGERVPADARIILSNNLKVDEAAISGESVPVNKFVEKIEREYLPIAEQKNIIFKGTNILSGSGKAIITATGVNTVMGKIAQQITATDTDVPLKKNIANLSRIIIISVGLINVFLFFAGIYLGKGVKEMFLMIVSLSVSVIPEGLPVVLTVVLALGAWRMSKNNALVKRMQAVDALGQAEIIAVDKTGTITKNEMVVQKVFVDNNFFEINGVGYEPKGDVALNGKIVEPMNHPDLIFAVENAALCSGARISFSEQEKRWMVSGDPTEASLLSLAQKIGFHKNVLDSEYPLVLDFPFDYQLKLRASLRKNKNKNFLITIGAPENILKISKKIWHNGKSCAFLEKEKENLKNIFEKMSEDGLRVVALAVENDPPKNLMPSGIKEVTFVSFFGMNDDLRQEVAEAMDRAKKAGVKVVMITGDHIITAKAIAKKAGIYKEGDKIISGEQIELMSEEELSKEIINVSVFARVSPDHKLRIINAFKLAKKVVAMTGDGVNDAPSLVSADLGVAMGKIGTEVAKEASDIVLLDDNFGTIILAVEEGRSIYKNIRKVILYFFSTSIGEILTIGGALLMGYPLPLLPSQIIWLNFITDGFLIFPLATEKNEKNLLLEKFKKPSKYIIDSLMIQRMIVMALPMMIGTLIIFSGIFQQDLVKAQTMALLVLAVFQWFNAWNCRSENDSIFQKNIFSNKYLILVTILVAFLQILLIYNPFLQKIFHTTALSVNDWILVTLVASTIIIAEELRKLFYRMWKKRKNKFISQKI